MSNLVLMKILEGASHCRKPGFTVPLVHWSMLAHHTSNGTIWHKVHHDVHPRLQIQMLIKDFNLKLILYSKIVYLGSKQVVNFDAVWMLDGTEDGQLAAQIIIQFALVFKQNWHHFDGIHLAVFYRLVHVGLATRVNTFEACIATFDDNIHVMIEVSADVNKRRTKSKSFEFEESGRKLETQLHYY